MFLTKRYLLQNVNVGLPDSVQRIGTNNNLYTNDTPKTGVLYTFDLSDRVLGADVSAVIFP